MFENLWVEKYRPKVLDDLIVTHKNRTIIDCFVAKKEIPNILLVGSPGVGKTTLAKIVVNSILNCQYLYINASDENGIDTIRSKVTQFAQTMSLDGQIKVIILDECDGLSQDAQRALLGEGVIVDDDQKKRLAKFVKSNYPDFRKIINEVQKFCIDGNLQITNSSSCTEFTKQIWLLISNGHVLKLRKHIIENEEKFGSDYQVLMKTLFNYIDSSSKIPSNKKKMYLVVIAEALYRSAFVADQEINCYSCLIQLSEN